MSPAGHGWGHLHPMPPSFQRPHIWAWELQMALAGSSGESAGTGDGTVTGPRPGSEQKESGQSRRLREEHRPDGKELCQ